MKPKGNRFKEGRPGILKLTCMKRKILNSLLVVAFIVGMVLNGHLREGLFI